jgi:hypothetical protein
MIPTKGLNINKKGKQKRYKDQYKSLKTLRKNKKKQEEHVESVEKIPTQTIFFALLATTR